MGEKSRIRFRRKGRSISIALMLSLYLLVLFAPVALAAGQKPVFENIGEAKKGVMRLVALNQSKNDVLWTGSAFGVGSVGKETDIFVTNRHCIYNEDTRQIWPEIYLALDDEAFYIANDTLYVKTDHMVKCKVLYPTKNDPEYPDFAVLQAERTVEGRIALPLMEADKAPDGTDVVAIGYPGSTDSILGPDASGNVVFGSTVEAATLTNGVISQKRRMDAFDGTYLIHHSARINSGNSGGPLLTKEGYVIGINTYGTFIADEENRDFTEWNGAVYIDYTMNKLDELGITYNVFPKRVNTGLIIFAASAAAVTTCIIFLISRKRKPTIPQYRLQGLTGSFANRRFPLDNGIRMGSLQTGNDLIFPRETNVSRTHCRLFVQDGVLYLMDLGSTNGTWMRGQRLPLNQPIRLQEGDVFYLAQASESFRIDVNHQRKG